MMNHQPKTTDLPANRSKIVRINPDQPDEDVLRRAARILSAGGILIHPTETVYGLAALYSREDALMKTVAIKGRSPAQPFSIMVNSVRQILEISGVGETWVEAFLQELFPAAVTVLIPRLRELSINFWNQFPFLGFRYPQHILSTRLVEVVGEPLITTSANLSGEPPVHRFADLSPVLLKKADLALDGGETAEKIPSTIIKIRVAEKRIEQVREGALDWEKIQNLFAKY